MKLITNEFGFLLNYIFNYVDSKISKGYGGTDVPLSTYIHMKDYDENIKFISQLLEKMGYEVKFLPKDEKIEEDEDMLSVVHVHHEYTKYTKLNPRGLNKKPEICPVDWEKDSDSDEDVSDEEADTCKCGVNCAGCGVKLS